MKKYILICIISLFCIQMHAYEERNLLQKKLQMINLEESLLLNQKWVTYPKYEDRAGWDSLVGANKEALIKDGEKYLTYNWKVIQATDYLEYTRTGNRSDMQAKYGANTNAISALFLAEMTEGKGRFLDQLTNGIFHMCEMTTWAISAHMTLQKSKETFPDKNCHVLELVSTDMGASLSWIYFFLNKEFDKVHPLISKRLYTEIQNRIITPYLEESHFWWMATNVTAESGMVNNWNPWCNSNVLQSFLLIENDKERLLKGIEKSIISVDKFINYYRNDGACEEGPSYWGHAPGKLYDYLQMLNDATDSKLNIFSEPLIRNMGEYISRTYIANGWVVNFADASAKSTQGHHLIYRYGKAIGSIEMQQFSAYLNKLNPSKISVDRDLYRCLADFSCDKDIAAISPIHKPTPFTWYPETEFCYMSTDRLFFASKGGYNDESHNHNDAGTFSLYVDGSPVFIDVGVGTYTKKTFSSERYTIWTMQSDYHNLPRINGFPQSFGKQYKAQNVKADGNKKSFSLDISKAYTKDAGVKVWMRNYKLSKNDLTIDDQFDITNATIANQLNFMTCGVVDTSKDGCITIKLNDKSLQMLYDKNEFTVSIEKIGLDDTRLSKVWGSDIQRISLNAKNVVNKGKYKITIKI